MRGTKLTRRETKKPKTKMARPSKEQVLRIENTEFTIGDILEIAPKPDLDAPSGFIEHGTTKLLMQGIKEIKSIGYDEAARLWDTGFDKDSDVNRKIPQAEREATVALWNKLIKEPYEKKYRVDANSANDDFWGGSNEKNIKPYMYEVYTNKRFDTRDEKDLFDLFHVLKQGAVCEPREKDPNLQRSANYCIKNIKKSQTAKEEKIENKYEAAAVLDTLLTLDSKKDDTLYTVLEWINIPNIRNAEKSAVKKTVLKSFEDDKNGAASVDKFLEAYKMTKSDTEKEVMEMFSVLNKLYARKKVEFRKRQFFMPDGTFLGNHLKEASRKAAVDSELRDKIENLYKDTITK